MKLINRRCECCGASEFIRLGGNKIKCAYCDSEYIVDEREYQLHELLKKAEGSWVEAERITECAKYSSEYRKLCQLRDQCESEVKKAKRKRFSIMLILIILGFIFAGSGLYGLLPICWIVALVFFFAAFAARNNIRKEYGYYNLINDINHISKLLLENESGRVWL